MNILVTGAKGFIGRNLIATLNNIEKGIDSSFGVKRNLNIFAYDKDTDAELLDSYCRDCDFVYHLAGVNRPKDQREFMEGNCEFTSLMLECLMKHKNYCPVMFASSIQARLDNPYGQSKRAGEELVVSYAEKAGTEAYVYRFPNVFGKWCRPNYNSVVATFCYNIARELPIQIHDSATRMSLVYIDDVVAELIALLQGGAHCDEQGHYYVPETYSITLGETADLLYSFKKSHAESFIPDMTGGSLAQKLYATYLSYLPKEQLSYPLKMNVDKRGSFTELFRTIEHGQFSVNIIKSGVTKGNHWHHTKNEKFVVVSGNAMIQLREIDSKEIITYRVSGEKMEVVEIPVGYTHSITNEGATDLVVFIWSSECFNPHKPDTYSMRVDDFSV